MHIVAEVGSTVPLSLVVNRSGSGGINGLVPTVALRQGALPSSYLDWSDSTFKTSGWVTKYAALTAAERGHYQRLLNLSTINAVAGTSYVVQFFVSSGDVQGEAEDVILVVPSVSTDTTLLRKALTNRMEETAGSPGQLTLFDDDGVTVLMRWDLRDATGGAVVSTVGTPARRGARRT